LLTAHSNPLPPHFLFLNLAFLFLFCTTAVPILHFPFLSGFFPVPFPLLCCCCCSCCSWLCFALLCFDLCSPAHTTEFLFVAAQQLAPPVAAAAPHLHSSYASSFSFTPTLASHALHTCIMIMKQPWWWWWWWWWLGSEGVRE